MTYNYRVEYLAQVDNGSVLPGVMFTISNLYLYTASMLQTICIKVGTLSKNAVKTKNGNLLNYLNFYLTDKSTEKIFSVFFIFTYYI